jgi:LAO/AO transport system kinase
MELNDFIEQIKRGHYRSLSRAIRLIQERDPRMLSVLKILYSLRKEVPVIGITGSPGAGKSSLLDRIGNMLCSEHKKIAILAIDPSSPFSGGALLGDRIRMEQISGFKNVFIRSIATHGVLGGVFQGIFESVELLKAAQFDYIFIETVGVGQNEVDIFKYVDTCCVVLVPGMGDIVQTFKAGILEIADIFIVNKADKNGADELVRDLHFLLSLGSSGTKPFQPEIVSTSAVENSGIDELLQALVHHQKVYTDQKNGFSVQKSLKQSKEEQFIKEYILDSIVRNLKEKFLKDHNHQFEQLVEACSKKTLSPYEAAEQLSKSIALA